MRTSRSSHPPRSRRTGMAMLAVGLSLLGLVGPTQGQTEGIPRGAETPAPVTDLQALPPPPLPLQEPLGAFGTPPEPRVEMDPEAPEPMVVGDLVEVVSEPTVELTLHVGRSRLFNLKRPVARIFIANPAIANVRFLDEEEAARPEGAEPRLLDLYGLSFGTTTLTLWDEQDQATAIRIRVTIDTHDLERRITQIFPGADVRVSQVGPQIILDGQVPNAKTMAEVLQIVRATLLGEALSLPVFGGGGGVNPQVSRTDDGVRRAAFQEPAPVPVPIPVPSGVDPLTGAPVPNPAQPTLPPGALPQPGAGPALGLEMNAEPVPPAIAAAAPATALQEEALGIIPFQTPLRGGGGTIMPGTIVNRVRVPGPRQILLKVKIAELNRTALRQLGVNWQRITDGAVLNSFIGNPGRILSPSNLSPLPSQLYGIFDEGRFTLYINALRQNGLAKILAEPNLVALDGQPAEFLAGGRLPYPVPQSSAAMGGSPAITVQFAQFGAILRFLPHILADDTIRLDVTPVFSQPDYSLSTSLGGSGTPVPGFRERRARTVVQLREGQTLAIAGLLSTQTNATTKRIPGLGDLPIVGPWFSQNQIETQESELVVLVTPMLVDPMEESEVPPSPGDRVWEPNDWEFYFLGRLEGRTGHPFRATVRYLDPLDIMKHFQSENQWVIGPHGHAD